MREIGYVPQVTQFDPLFPASAIDIVLMGQLDRVRFGFYGPGCRQPRKLPSGRSASPISPRLPSPISPAASASAC